MSVWGAGGGLGQMSCKLAGLGHRALLNDISGEMLALAVQEIDRAGLDVNFRPGLRVAFDYLGKDIKAQRSNDDLLAIENLLREQDAFWRLGRYVHFIAMKPV
jgi:hypothetical protein